MSLLQKSLNGVFWNGLGRIVGMGFEFVVGVILARLLSPREFGLIGMITVFVAICDIFVNSGFSQALVRKTNCKPEDYSTTFIFNLVVSAGCFGLLFIAAPFVAQFYNEPQLTSLLRILSLTLIVSSLALVQRVTLTQNIDFKLQTQISIIASVFSGVLSIFLAMNGFGVWSLVLKTLSREVVSTSLFWFWNKWRPIWRFSRQSFKELFGFGSRLLASGLIGTVFNNINYIVIGKYFSSADLGFYTRAELFKNLPSQNIESILSSVAYPVLAQVQDDPVKMKEGFRRLILSAVFIVTVSMALLSGAAEPLIIGLIGEKWRQSILYLQLLSVMGVLYPLNSINVNLLNIVGRSDLYLKLQFIMQLLSLPVIFIGAFFGIKMMIIGFIVHGIIGFFIYSRYSSEYANYSAMEQIIEVLPVLFIGLITVSTLIGFNWFFKDPIVLIFGINMLLGLSIILFLSYLFKIESFLYLKNMFVAKIKLFLN